MATTLLLPAPSFKLNYIVSFYENEISFENRVLQMHFYGRDYQDERCAKNAAFKYFQKVTGWAGFYNIVTITEHNGIQIASKKDPCTLKTAIERLIAVKTMDPKFLKNKPAE